MNATLSYAGREVIFCDCDKTDHIQGQLLKGQWYDMALLDVLYSLGAEGNYLDIGAYVGTFSVFAAMFCPCERIIAIEPQVDIFQKLCRNADSANTNRRIEAYRVALSDHNGTGSMSETSTNRGGARLIAGNSVPVLTLDSMMLPPITVAKIDVENSELAVLRGGRRTLDNVKHLFLESWPEKTCKEYGVEYTGEHVVDLLTDIGFRCQCELPGDNFYYKKP